MAGSGTGCLLPCSRSLSAPNTTGRPPLLALRSPVAHERAVWPQQVERHHRPLADHAGKSFPPTLLAAALLLLLLRLPPCGLLLLLLRRRRPGWRVRPHGSMRTVEHAHGGAVSVAQAAELARQAGSHRAGVRCGQGREEAGLGYKSGHRPCRSRAALTPLARKCHHNKESSPRPTCHCREAPEPPDEAHAGGHSRKVQERGRAVLPARRPGAQAAGDEAAARRWLECEACKKQRGGQALRAVDCASRSRAQLSCFQEV